MQYRVNQTIVSGNIDSGEPVIVEWYKGDSLAMAMSAMGSATAQHEDTRVPAVPESVRIHVLDVKIEFLADCPWRGVGLSQRPYWAKVPCEGREVETSEGPMCEDHNLRFRYSTAKFVRDINSLPGATDSTEACPGACLSTWHKVDEGQPKTACPACGSWEGV